MKPSFMIFRMSQLLMSSQLLQEANFSVFSFSPGAKISTRPGNACLLGRHIYRMEPIFSDSLPSGVYGMGGYISGSVVNFFFQGHMSVEVWQFWRILGQKSDFSNMALEASYFGFIGLEGCIHGIWVCIGEKNQTILPKMAFQGRKTLQI